MEILLANAVGTLRRETLNGREYLVASATLIVPGVLNGSRGALYYPPEEISANYDAWNGMPMVVYHPVVNGKNVSARSPKVLHDSEVGRVFNVQISSDGKLQAEAWFDVLATKRVDPRVYNALTSNKPIELSTGLFTENTPMKGKCPRSGMAYDYIARNYRPDHLAILPDQKGACSLNDGCGVLVNAGEPVDETEYDSLFELSTNTWSPEARAAAMAARKKAHGASSIALRATQATPGHDKIAPHPANAASFHAKAGRHEHAAREHEAAAAKHEAAGHTGAAAKHREAARAHREAHAAGSRSVPKDEFGSRKHTHNAKYKFSQEDCPKCGASIEGDPDSGKCSSCGEMWGKAASLHREAAEDHRASAAHHSTRDSILPSENSTMPASLKEPLTPERRTEIVNQLCTNCACWKGKDDKDVLNKLTDDKLVDLEKHAKEEAAKDAVVNAVKVQFGELTVNALTEKITEGKTASKKLEDLQAVENAKKTPTPTPAPAVVPPVTPTPVPTVMNMKEWLAAAPPEAQATWNNVLKIEQDEKVKIATYLTSNITDATVKAAELTRLTANTMTLDNLREKLRERQLFAPPPTPTGNNGQTPAPLYLGSNPPVTNATPRVKKEPMRPLTINYAELAKEQAAAGAPRN